MNRRTLLAWISRLVAVGSALVVAIPGVRYLMIPLRRRSGGAIQQRVSRLGDLPVGQPVLRSIVANRKDAWTVYESERVGQVWLIRDSEASVAPAETKIRAFTSVCPHLGCSVQHDTSKQQFMCPCHNAYFRMTGEPVADQELGYKNPTPRGMDPLACQIVQDPATQEWWVEVTYEKFVYGLTTQVPKT